MLFGLLAFLITLPGVFAQFYVQVEEKTYSPGDKIKVSWIELDSVDVSGQKYAKVLLCTCQGSEFKCKDNIGVDPFNPQEKKSVELDVSDFSSKYGNGYYTVQFYTQVSKIGAFKNTIAYSNTWFQLEGMSGSSQGSKGCDVPYGLNNGFDTASSVSWSWTVPASYSSDPYAMPYSMQSGPTRFATRQPTPGTKVTAKSTPSRRYPTSSVSIRSTYFINPYLPETTKTKDPLKTVTQYTNYAKTIATTPKGRKPTPILASFETPTASSSSSGGTRRRRWADF